MDLMTKSEGSKTRPFWGSLGAVWVPFWAIYGVFPNMTQTPKMWFAANLGTKWDTFRHETRHRRNEGYAPYQPATVYYTPPPVARLAIEAYWVACLSIFGE